MHEDIQRWNKKFAGREISTAPDPDDCLIDNLYLPGIGDALDIASGSGQNAIYLAQKGLNVTAIDGSETGMQLAEGLADNCGVAINRIVTDLDNYQLIGSFDLIIVLHYLNRDLFRQIPTHLKPGGVLVAKTFNEDFLQGRPSFNPDFVLKPDELLTLFSGLDVLQHLQSPDDAPGKSLLIAQKS
ncbi:MAG: tellurite methyltransferase [Parasphingorhabdus sp.]|jgi:tellurite methyltransferase